MPAIFPSAVSFHYLGHPSHPLPTNWGLSCYKDSLCFWGKFWPYQIFVRAQSYFFLSLRSEGMKRCGPLGDSPLQKRTGIPPAGILPQGHPSGTTHLNQPCLWNQPRMECSWTCCCNSSRNLGTCLYGADVGRVDDNWSPKKENTDGKRGRYKMEKETKAGWQSGELCERWEACFQSFAGVV